MPISLNDIIAQKGFVLADGAMGTNLFPLGLQSGDAPELWNVDRPEAIAVVHANFIAAGSDLVLTNSFGGSRYRLKLHNAQDRVGELNKRAAQIARTAAMAAGRDVIVGGSIGPTGELIQPLGELAYEDAVEAFREQALALAEGGADLIWIETMSAREEVEAAVEGAKSAGLPIAITMTFDTAGRTMMGVSPEDAGHFFASLDAPIVAVGTNCGIGPAEAIASLIQMDAVLPEGMIMIAKGNCGVPQFKDGEFQFSGTPELMAKYARMARDLGAKVIGGCCGTSGPHLTAMADALRDYSPGDKPDLQKVVETLGTLVNALPTGEADSSGQDGERRRRRRRKSAD